MIIGILQENGKQNFSLTEEFVSVLVSNKQTVLVEGSALNARSKNYLTSGAYVIDKKEQIIDRADIIIKKGFLTSTEAAMCAGREKIIFTDCNIHNHGLVEKLLDQKVAVIHYNQLKDVRKKKVSIKTKHEFSRFILPYILELAQKGLQALVNDEDLRDALYMMNGKVYNQELAELYQYPCYEF